MNNKFLNFIDPFLLYIDSGKLFRKPFSWLYLVFAAGNVVLPFYLLYKAIDAGLFDLGAKFVFAFLLTWLFILAACWAGVQIWWNRKDKVQETSPEGSEFPATPVISHFIQTLGEWIGVFIAVVGFGVALVANVFLGEQAAYLTHALGLPFGGGPIGMITFPIYGFLTLVVMRFFAEQFRALAAIANNTKK